jgi:hypothetical protein
MEHFVIAKEILAAGRAVVADNARLGIALARSMRLVGEVGVLRDGVLDAAAAAMAGRYDDDSVRLLEEERGAS